MVRDYLHMYFAIFFFKWQHGGNRVHPKHAKIHLNSATTSIENSVQNHRKEIPNY